MSDSTSRLPLRGEYPETILARVMRDQNAGVDPTDPLYAENVPGSVWDDINRALALEVDRVHDRLTTEVPAASLPTMATGGRLEAWADCVGLERKPATVASGTARFEGPEGTDIPAGTMMSTEAPSPDADPVVYQTVTSVEIPAGGVVETLAVALDPGTIGNVPASTVTLLDSVLDVDTVTVTNPSAMTGGSDVETDEHLQVEVGKRLRGTAGGGNLDYYVNLATRWPGIGFATAQANVPNRGDVRLVVTDINNDPLSDLVVDAFQLEMDPSDSPTQGEGAGTVGARVTVTTPGTTNVRFAAVVVPEVGYSLDGSAGTRPLRGPISASLGQYVGRLVSGDDVLYYKAASAVVDVVGVKDLVSLTINDASVTLTIADTDVAVLESVELSI